MTLMGNADPKGDVPKREPTTTSFSSSLTSCSSLACCSCADGAFALPFGGFVALGCLLMEIVVGLTRTQFNPLPLNALSSACSNVMAPLTSAACLRSEEHTSDLQSLMRI